MSGTIKVKFRIEHVPQLVGSDVPKQVICTIHNCSGLIATTSGNSKNAKPPNSYAKLALGETSVLPLQLPPPPPGKVAPNGRWPKLQQTEIIKEVMHTRKPHERDHSPIKDFWYDFRTCPHRSSSPSQWHCLSRCTVPSQIRSSTFHSRSK